MNQDHVLKAKKYAAYWILCGPQGIENWCDPIMQLKDKDMSDLITEASHTFAVADIMGTLAPIRGLEAELSRVIGYLHDIGRLRFGEDSKKHALLGAMDAERFINDEMTCSLRECGIIVQAIARHTSKKRIDTPYDELLKDADAFQRFLENDIVMTKPSWKIRIIKVLGEMSEI